MREKEIQFGWAVRYKGPRGGNWQTPFMSEEEARARFATFKQSRWAQLIHTKPAPIFGAMTEIVQQTAIIEIENHERWVVGYRKDIKSKEKAIAACQESIKKYKAMIKEET
jgi:hypothetical protein